MARERKNTHGSMAALLEPVILYRQAGGFNTPTHRPSDIIQDEYKVVPTSLKLNTL